MAKHLPLERAVCPRGKRRTMRRPKCLFPERLANADVEYPVNMPARQSEKDREPSNPDQFPMKIPVPPKPGPIGFVSCMEIPPNVPVCRT